MQTNYKFAAICKDGHCINALLDSPIPKDSYCEKCGAAVIALCPNCQEPIRGKFDSPYVLDLTPFDVPKYCRACGNPYPWTESAIQSASTIIREGGELDDAQSEALVESLPDIITETPRTRLAVIRLKKALTAVGKFTGDGLRQFAIDFGCEFVKSQLGL